MPDAALPILFIGHRWPEPNATAAGQRLLQLMDLYSDGGSQIHFGTASGLGRYPANLEERGIVTHRLALNDSGFDNFLKRYGFGIVVFDRFLSEEAFGWRVRAALPDCRLVLDTEDLHSLRQSRQNAVLKGEKWEIQHWVADPTFTREMASILRCDQSLLISGEEYRLLSELLPLLKPLIFYLPFQMPLPDGPYPGFEARRDFVFIGNGNHKPNTDAIYLIKDKIWPGLSRRCPQATFLVYGAYLPKDIQELDDPGSRFRVGGWASDLPSVLSRARVQIAPLRFGAGIKGKLLQGLRFGLPTLTSPIGAEGIYSGKTPEALLADTSETFIEKATLLYREQGFWDKALELSLKRSKAHFRTEDSARVQIKTLLEPLTQVGNFSETTILQGLLRDSAFDRLRYMSRWIELKNAKGIGNS